MAPGTLKNSVVNNLEVHGSFYHDSVTRYLDYSAYNRCNLLATGLDVTSAIGVAALAEDHTAATVPTAITAATLVANAVNTLNADCIGAAGIEVYLPPAIKGSHVVLEVLGDIDQAEDVIIRVAPLGSASGGKDRYAGLHTAIVDILWKTAGTIPSGATAYAKTAGTVKIPTATDLKYEAVAANTNWLGVGSEIHLYCPKQGQWIVKIMAITETTGATGVISFVVTAME